MYIYTGSVWVHYYIVNSGSKEDPRIKMFVLQLCSDSYFNECRWDGTFANVAKYYYTCIKQAIIIYKHNTPKDFNYVLCILLLICMGLSLIIMKRLT